MVYQPVNFQNGGTGTSCLPQSFVRNSIVSSLTGAAQGVSFDSSKVRFAWGGSARLPFFFSGCGDPLGSVSLGDACSGTGHFTLGCKQPGICCDAAGSSRQSLPWGL